MAQTAENASCVEGQKQEKHVGAHVTLSCERLFSLSDADSLQGLGNLPAVNSALLKDFEEHQLLEQVRSICLSPSSKAACGEKQSSFMF